MSRLSNLFLLGLLFIATVGWAQYDISYNTPVDTRTSFSSQPQKFEFKGYMRDSEIESVPTDMLEEHVLGIEIAKKLYLIDEKFTYTEPVIPGNPRTKTIIRKPVIYTSIKKIDKQLVKKVKHGEMTKEYAAKILNQVLTVSLNMLASDTEAFEQELEKDNSTDFRIDLFVNRVQLVY